MKAGDLIKRKGKGWLAITIDTDEENQIVTFLWANRYVGNRTYVDSCSMCMMEVINEA